MKRNRTGPTINNVVTPNKAVTGSIHQVTIMRDSSLVYPELWMQVYIAGDEFEQRQFSEMFMRSRCTKVDDPLEADLVVFTGGPDVNPILYDEEAHPMTKFDSKRDEEDLKLAELCLNEGIPMLGICRGAQFLHVMMGGKLYQHVDGHIGDHSIFDKNKNRILHRISSVHHQAVIADTSIGMEVIADKWSSQGKHWKNNTDFDEKVFDVEAFYYRDTAIIGIQGHPEYRGYNHFMQWTLELLNELVVCSPDIGCSSGKYRIKPDILAMRDKKIHEQIMNTSKGEIESEVTVH